VNLKCTFLILFFIPSVVFAQWVSDIKTESDWEYYFRNGIIDYNSYQLLRELAEGAEVNDTTDFIVSTLGISPVEIIDKLEYTEVGSSRQKISASQKPPSPWSGRLRLGSEIKPAGNESYALLSANSANFAMEFKLRDKNGSRIMEKRFVKLQRNGYSLIAGNFTADIGCGFAGDDSGGGYHNYHTDGG